MDTLFNKIYLRAAVTNAFGRDATVWLDRLTPIIIALALVIGLWRLLRAIRHGARPLDMLAIGLGAAVLGDRLMTIFWHDHVTWLGAGLGLTAAALLTPKRPVKFFTALRLPTLTRNVKADEWTLAEAAAHPDFPIIRWTQLVDTGQLQEDARNSFELGLMLTIIFGGGAIGLYLGGLTGALLGLFCGLWLSPSANRNAVAPKLETVGGYVPMPGRWSERPLTPLEQAIDREPIVEVHDAMAFLSSPVSRVIQRTAGDAG